MSTLKDKLANSVRQAKSAAAASESPPSAAQPSRAARAPATAPASHPARPRGAEPAADAQNPVPSASEIFPRRVWPD